MFSSVIASFIEMIGSTIINLAYHIQAEPKISPQGAVELVLRA